MSSQEAYVPPTAGSSFGAGAAMGGSGGGAGGASFASSFQEGPTTQYMCGDCASQIGLKKGDPIRCKECGHRILYKERTKRSVLAVEAVEAHRLTVDRLVQFEAR